MKNTEIIEKLKELFNLLILLAGKIRHLSEGFISGLTDNFIWLFGAILQFLTDLIKLILSYF